MIRYKKTSIFMDAKETTSVLELKKMVQGITKRDLEDIRLYKDDQPLEDNKTLGDCGFTSSTARAQAPATIGLAFRGNDGEFEPLEIAALSTPPELPDVMRPQESSASQQQEQVAS
ncbi:hypothetical protein CAPTEDRAFT_154388 [Capitella teleta]|uniref:Elongin-B n=1 Tax=Capitella teleta TaxID=283909 RepID=R7UUF6_CAPTE|nr:hypothetical protein CAPTEDRAFT_154388 [Capitella teleta]|eukprot:ELU09825.1 hypothetical protein CAPTEDRAFT_154388 [Capitella teleta]